MLYNKGSSTLGSILGVARCMQTPAGRGGYQDGGAWGLAFRFRFYFRISLGFKEIGLPTKAQGPLRHYDLCSPEKVPYITLILPLYKPHYNMVVSIFFHNPYIAPILPP